MNIVFLGSPPAAVPSLSAVHDAVGISVVVTQPDRPQGRSGAPQPTAVAEAATELEIPTVKPTTRAELLEAFPESVDLAVVVAYGRILPPEILERAQHGFVNLHFSLLPRWRGAAPVVHALLAGDPRIGFSLMQLDAGMDTGPTYERVEIELNQDDTAGTVTERMAKIGAETLSRLAARLPAELPKPRPQDEALATRAPKFARDDARLSAGTSVSRALRMVRCFNPRPVAHIELAETSLRVFSATTSKVSVDQGQLAVVDDLLHMGLSDGSIVLESVQASGHRMMDGATWARGYRGELHVNS